MLLPQIHPGFLQGSQAIDLIIEKGKVFKWTKDYQDSFEELKKHLTTMPVLVLPDLSRGFICIVMLHGEAMDVY
jgi:hypothetical protein